jgi:hypothetical protein
LSTTEVQVIRALLADQHRSDKEGVRSAGTPRTTFQSIRRRAFLSGWLRTRYIPEPVALGYTVATVRLAETFTDKWRDAIRALKTETTLVLLASSETMFSIEFHRGGAPPAVRSGPGTPFRQSWSVNAELAKGNVCVFFDFEGVWSKWAVGTQPTAYPRSLTRSVGPQFSPGESLPNRRLRDIEDFLLQVRNLGDEGRPRLSFSQGRLPHRQRLLLESGLVIRRVIPDFSDIPPVQGERIEWVIFATGRVRREHTATEMFTALSERAGAAPFFFSADRERVLMAGFAATSRTSTARRISPFQVLQEYAYEIEVIRERVESLAPVVDYRGERLVQGREGPGNG